MRRLIRDVSTVLIISGVLLLADAAVTLLWQEPVTAVIALIKRGEINKHLLTTAPALSAFDRRALAALRALDRRIAFFARREQRQARTGDAIGQLVISKIGTSLDVVQGTDSDTLEKGPGHYPATSFPGLGRTMAIAGHRTTYLAPFRSIDKLKTGDKIVLKMPYAQFTYDVEHTRIVLPTALWVTRYVGYERLVLSACYPLYSAAKRIIVFARLTQQTPLGAARRSFPSS